MNTSTPLFILAGPTASGKTELAHLLAERRNLRLLSMDAMMVYQGMSVGTAKPSPEEIERYDYAGLNLANPGTPFSTGKWLSAVSAQLDDRPALAVGGTGLYLRALLQGLATDDPPPVPDLPEGVEALQARVREYGEHHLQNLSDPQNPRRLQRALAWLAAGKTPPHAWSAAPDYPVPVLRRDTAELNHRIELRAAAMFESGLLEETRRLLQAGQLTGTAARAIGYAEATAVLEGSLSRAEAVEAVVARTRRYAKRQRTWFRNQHRARWIDVAPGDPLKEIADKIDAIWQETGPTLFDRSRYV